MAQVARAAQRAMTAHAGPLFSDAVITHTGRLAPRRPPPKPSPEPSSSSSSESRRRRAAAAAAALTAMRMTLLQEAQLTGEAAGMQAGAPTVVAGKQRPCVRNERVACQVLPG